MIISNKTEQCRERGSGGRGEGAVPARWSRLEIDDVEYVWSQLVYTIQRTLRSCGVPRLLVSCGSNSLLLSLPSCHPACLLQSLLARNLLAVPSKRRRTVYQDRDWNRSDVSHQLAARRLQLDKCDCSTPLYPQIPSPLYLPTLDHWIILGRTRTQPELIIII